MNQTTKNLLSRPASTEAVTFTDGMLVTADDLQAAMHYPLSVVQVLLRSYFGCGIVCGLEVTDPNADRPPPEDPECETDRGFVIKIAPGVALGCDGYPIELCSEVKLDLSPDPCGCKPTAPETRFIAIRRERAAEPSPRGGCGGGCGCGCGGSGSGDPKQQCTRQRDHILIQAFDAAPKGACMQPPRPLREQEECERGEEPERKAESLCECMHHCSDCDRCADPWVVIAVLQVDGEGIVADTLNSETLVNDEGGRRHVKPIACLCSADTGWSNRHVDLVERYRKWESSMGLFEQRLGVLEGRDPGTVKRRGGTGVNDIKS